MDFPQASLVLDVWETYEYGSSEHKRAISGSRYITDKIFTK